MASVFGSPSPFGASNASSATFEGQSGPELEEITTEALGFEAIAGDTKLQLLPKPWPSDALPPSTASLLSVASKKGLLAAAGPDSVIIASTDAVRQGYSSPASFSPQLTINVGTRLSHVAFSSDEESLVLSAEHGGGLSVHETSSLLQGNTQAAFEMATNGCALRAILPNPSPDQSQYFAIITTDGQLLLADLKSRQFIKGSAGEVLRGNVSSASWSNRGKQIVAGLADGSCVQLTPDGQVKAEFGPPASLEGDHHVSMINWLENEMFMICYTLPVKDPDSMSSPSAYYIVTKSKPPERKVVFQKLPEQAPPFGLPRHPAVQFTVRLKDFEPNLTDVIAVASSASSDISMVTRSKSPLTNDVLPESAVNVFTGTNPADDSRRASLPFFEGMDTALLGIALDLSSKEKVKRPLPREEYEESQSPIPALVALNNQGVLATWWFMYAESIRQGTMYSGLTIAGGLKNKPEQNQPQASAFATPPPSSNAFGTSAFGQQSTSMFGSPSQAKAAFGAPSQLSQQSPWGSNANNTLSTPAFGQSGFAAANNSSTPAATSGFGMTSSLGNRSSPWASSNTGSAFGQPSKPTATAFGQPSTTEPSKPTPSAPPASGGFASFANAKGFAAAGSSAGSPQSIFGKPSSNAFASNQGQSSIFGKPEEKQATSAFDQQGFQLDSTFKADGTAASDGPKPASQPGASLFGASFGASLGNASMSQPKDSDMNEAEDTPPQDNSTSQESENGSSGLAATISKNEPSASSGLFGKNSSGQPAVQSQKTNSAGFSFGAKASEPATQAQSDKIQQQAKPQLRVSPKIKQEPQSEDDEISPLNEEEAKPPQGYGENDEHGDTAEQSLPATPDSPDAGSPASPLPPESTSKTAFAAGDSSSSSKSSDDAPLPPDFVPQKSKLQEVEAAHRSQSSQREDSDRDQEEREEGEVDLGPEDDLGDEGSGVDVAQELSPASSKDSSKLTSGSSFGHPNHNQHSESLFSPVQSKSNAQRPALFGELSKVSFDAPSDPVSHSPFRSASPTRPNSLRVARPENSRSTSAPSPIRSMRGHEVSTVQASVSRPAKESASQVRARERERYNEEQQQRRDMAGAQSLSDEEDEYTRAMLSTEAPPSTILDKFIAHQDYVGKVEKPGIPGQIEKVYRDINSMIDTLGLNARSLTSFIKAHEHRAKPGQREIDDLEDLEWCLVESEDLDAIEDDLLASLRAGKVTDVPDKMNCIDNIKSDVSQLHRQSLDLGRTIASSGQTSFNRNTLQRPLDLDQQTQIRDIRKAFKHFQKQLSDAEEGIMVLKTKLSLSTNGKATNGKTPIKQPTVEAVEHTIRKMTNLVTEKSEDVERLALEMDTLNLSLQGGEDSLISENLGQSRQGSPSLTQSSNRRPGSRDSTQSPDKKGNRTSLVRPLYRQSPLKQQALAADSLPDIRDLLSAEQIAEYQETARRKTQINDMIKDVFGSTQIKVRPLD